MPVLGLFLRQRQSPLRGGRHCRSKPDLVKREVNKVISPLTTFFCLNGSCPNLDASGSAGNKWPGR